MDVQTTHLVLAQFDKVTRAKNKWKCSLKGGVMTLNGKDVLFGKANGEFFWNWTDVQDVRDVSTRFAF